MIVQARFDNFMVQNNGSPMALSQRTTTVAVLRGLLGPNYGGERRFAKLAGRSPSWVKKVSAGIIPLGEEAARKLSDETGVSFRWLLGSVNRPPIATGTNEPYTEGFFAWYRTERQKGHPVRQCAYSPYELLPHLFGVGFAAGQKGKSTLFMWRLASFIDKAREEFGSNHRAETLTESLLDGDAVIKPEGHTLRLRDMWFVDRHVRGLPFNLGSPAANLVATRGLEKLRINTPQRPPFRASMLSSQKFFKV
jgi:hypothetical protein